MGDIVEFNGIAGQVFKFYTNDKDGRRFVKVACLMRNGEWPVNRFPLWPADRVEMVRSGINTHIGIGSNNWDVDREESIKR